MSVIQSHACCTTYLVCDHHRYLEPLRQAFQRRRLPAQHLLSLHLRVPATPKLRPQQGCHAVQQHQDNAALLHMGFKCVEKLGVDIGKNQESGEVEAGHSIPSPVLIESSTGVMCQCEIIKTRTR